MPSHSQTTFLGKGGIGKVGFFRVTGRVQSLTRRHKRPNSWGILICQGAKSLALARGCWLPEVLFGMANETATQMTSPASETLANYRLGLRPPTRD
jgi:hypothetical protein